MQKRNRAWSALCVAAALTLGGCTGSPHHAEDYQAPKVDVHVVSEPAHVGPAAVIVHVSDPAGHLLRLQRGDLFANWWDPTVGPIALPATPMVPMGSMPSERVSIDVTKDPGHYVVRVKFSRAGHWALQFHGFADDKYVDALEDVIVYP
jgi:hypothetical protein